MIKVVLFDFGGVLSETGKKGHIRRALADLYDASPEAIVSDEVQKQWRSAVYDDQQILEHLNRQYNKNITLDMFVKRIHKDIMRAEAVYDLAARLRQHNIHTGILSNVFSSTASVLERDGFYDTFDPIILSCREGYAKPDEQLYAIAIKRAGCQPQEILFIDDQEKCLPPANKLGMQTLLAVSSEQIVADTTALLKQENGLIL